MQSLRAMRTVDPDPGSPRWRLAGQNRPAIASSLSTLFARVHGSGCPLLSRGRLLWPPMYRMRAFFGSRVFRWTGGSSVVSGRRRLTISICLLLGLTVPAPAMTRRYEEGGGPVDFEMIDTEESV